MAQVLLSMDGPVEEIERHLEAALKLEKDDAHAWFLRGKVARCRRGDLVLAEKALLKAGASDPEDGDVAEELSMVFGDKADKEKKKELKKKYEAEAEKWARRGVELNSQGTDSMLRLGELVARDKTRTKEAESILRQAVKRHASLSTTFSLAQFLLGVRGANSIDLAGPPLTENIEEVIELLKQARDLGKKNGQGEDFDVITMLYGVLKNQGRYEEAGEINALSSLNVFDPEVIALYNEAVYMSQANGGKAPPEAEHLLRKALALNPTYPPALRGLVQCLLPRSTDEYFIASKIQHEIADLCRTYLKETAKETTSKDKEETSEEKIADRIDAHFKLGLILFTQCISDSSPEAKDHFAARGREAETTLRAALALDANHLPSLRTLGHVLTALKQDFKGAIACYNRAQNIEPDDVILEKRNFALAKYKAQLQAAGLHRGAAAGGAGGNLTTTKNS